MPADLQAVDYQPQEGIYYQRGISPPGFYTILFLEHSAQADATSVGNFLADLWQLYAKLKEGLVPDLEPAFVPSGNLRVLLGFGQPVFGLAGLGDQWQDARTSDWAKFQFSAPSDGHPGGPILIDSDTEGESGICYDESVSRNPAEAAVAVQFTADTPLAVERAVVETWKLIEDEKRKGGSPLDIRGVYAGSQRDDRRSWIDFHDGVSNLKPEEREGAIFIGAACPPAVPARPDWPRYGTYMAFIRLGFDLGAWRSLGKTAQEALVGRDRVGGCFMVRDPAAPDVGTPDPTYAPDLPIPDPPREPLPGTSLLPDTHVWRVRLGNDLEPACAPSSLRIYRQGYPFFETTSGSTTFRTGLNFVSFQQAPGSLARMLFTPRWLGRTNFGGAGGAAGASTRLVTAYAAGMFFVPPCAPDERFPGHAAFGA